MILTVTPNAAIDHTVYVENLEAGGLHRNSREHSQAGGKGVNVARILHAMGMPVRACVVVGGNAGRTILRDLETAGIETIPVFAEGESRTCLEIVEASGGRTTQLHGAGVAATAETARRLLQTLRAQLPEVDLVSVCGSLPPGLPPDCVARAVQGVREARGWIAVDTSGEPLAHAWKQNPDLVRVNREEVTEILGGRSAHPPYPELGSPNNVVVSDGPRSIFAWSHTQGGMTAVPPTVEPRNPIGCGDAMLASLLKGFASGAKLDVALKEAVGLAAADAESAVAGSPDLRRGAELAQAVSLRRTER